MVTSLQPGQSGLMFYRIGMDGVYTGRTMCLELDQSTVEKKHKCSSQLISLPLCSWEIDGLTRI